MIHIFSAASVFAFEPNRGAVETDGERRGALQAAHQRGKAEGALELREMRRKPRTGRVVLVEKKLFRVARILANGQETATRYP